MELTQTFGVDPLKVFVQLAIVFLVVGVPAIIATLRVLKSSSATTQPLWLAFIWLVPLIGSIAALLSVRSNCASWSKSSAI